MSTAEIALAAVTTVMTFVGGFVALRLRPLEDRMQNINADFKEDRERFDRRIGDIERSYLSRADLTNAIKDMNDNMNRGVDRIDAVVRALGAKVDHLSDRIGKVEASA
jgi:hypothetical protein